MNYRGSYRHLVKNSKSAIIAAIEIYNKPRFDYRDECFVILLLNAWELLLKAMLSKKKQSIFYTKKRESSYKTLSWTDAFTRASQYFPKEIDVMPVQKNLELLGAYRDNSVHFYNKPGFGVLMYALAQTSLVNFKDLLELFFDIDLSEEITWQLLPLGLKAPLDPITYLSGTNAREERKDAAVKQFLTELSKATREVEAVKSDTGRLLTVFTVSLQSTKKIENADVVVGVKKMVEGEGPLTILKPSDPNTTHPLRRKEALERLLSSHNLNVSPHEFSCIIWHYKIKERPEFYWKANRGGLVLYSHDLVTWISRLSAEEKEIAVTAYRDYQRKRTSPFS